MSKNSENEWIIDKDFDGHRIDYWLKKIKPNLSYPIICKIIRKGQIKVCLLYTSPSPRDNTTSRMPSSA